MSEQSQTCRHCLGWGKWSVPSTHQLHGQVCTPCGGTGRGLSAWETMLRWQLHGIEMDRRRNSGR